MAHKSLNVTVKRIELHLKMQQKNAESESANNYGRRPSSITTSHSMGGDVSLGLAEYGNDHHYQDEMLLRDTLQNDVSVVVQ